MSFWVVQAPPPQASKAVKCWIPHNNDKAEWAFERVDRGDGIGDTAHNGLMWYGGLMWGDPGDGGTWADPNFSYCSATPTNFPGHGYCGHGDDELYAWSTY